LILNEFLYLIIQVSLWTLDVVLVWVRYIGFEEYAQNFVDSKVDGDLLLQLDDLNIQNDLKITNGIHKKRFMRELLKLVKSCDFSSIDKHNVVPFLRDNPLLGENHLIYAYGLIKSGLSLDLMSRMSGTCLLDALQDIGVRKQAHRRRIADSINSWRNLMTVDPNPEDIAYDAYICNASLSVHGSKEFASLIAVNLKTHGAMVYDKDYNRPSTIKEYKNFILILSADTLSCENIEQADYYKDLVTALDRPDCNVVVVKESEFQMPDSDQLPEGIRRLTSFPSLTWYHEYQNAFMDRLMNLIRLDSNLMKYKRQSSTSSNSSCNSMSSYSKSGRSSPERSPMYQHFWPVKGMISQHATWISGFS
jgi:hypothetical protein